MTNLTLNQVRQGIVDWARQKPGAAFHGRAETRISAAARGDSGAEARAEPSERADEVREQLRDSPYAGQFTVGSVSDPRPLIVRCAACRGTGQPTPHAQAYLKESVCSGCKGAGVHRV